MHQSHSSSPYTPKRTHNGFYQPRYPEQGHGEATCSPCIKSSEDYVEKHMEPDEGLHKGALVAVVMQTALS